MFAKMKPMSDTIFPYMDPVGGIMPKKKWGAEDQRALRQLNEKYVIFTLFDMLYFDTLAFGSQIKNPPFIIPDPSSKNTNRKIEIKSYRQLFNLMNGVFNKALEEFSILFGEKFS